VGHIIRMTSIYLARCVTDLTSACGTRRRCQPTFHEEQEESAGVMQRQQQMTMCTGKIHHLVPHKGPQELSATS